LSDALAKSVAAAHEPVVKKQIMAEEEKANKTAGISESIDCPKLAVRHFVFGMQIHSTLSRASHCDTAIFFGIAEKDPSVAEQVVDTAEPWSPSTESQRLAPTDPRRYNGVLITVSLLLPSPRFLPNTHR
jgi:hypothetical protein